MSCQNSPAIPADLRCISTRVVAQSFDETMNAIARQAVVEPDMRRYLDGLRPRLRLIPAPPPTTHVKQWPVLRFNAQPVHEATITLASVELPSDWRKPEIRAALTPRKQWPVVVCGPGK
jgi:hypothetical protein